MKKLALFLSILLVLSTSIAYANTNNQDKIYKNEKVYHFNKDTIVNSNTFDSQTQKTYNEYKKQLNPDEYISGLKTMEVYVKEEKDSKTNTIISSSLMTEKEVQALLTTDVITQPLLPSTNFAQKYKLFISIVIVQGVNYTYTISGRAEWSGYSTVGEYNGEGADYGEDFLGITWGGNGELVKTSNSIYGLYDNPNAGTPLFYTAQSDGYKGYVWSFEELKPVYHGFFYVNYIDATVNLKKTYSTYLGRVTNAKLTYIHTYQAPSGSISIKPDLNVFAAPGVTLSSVAKQWTLEIDAGDLWY